MSFLHEIHLPENYYNCILCGRSSNVYPCVCGGGWGWGGVGRRRQGVRAPQANGGGKGGKVRGKVSGTRVAQIE